MATEAQNLPFSAYLVYIFYSLLSSRYICRESFTNSPLFMQNKPNLLDAQMNISSVLTKDYENKPRLTAPGKQTQSNPIPPPPFLPPKSPIFIISDFQNRCGRRHRPRSSASCDSPVTGLLFDIYHSFTPSA